MPAARARLVLERRANVPTGAPRSVRILYISIRIHWSITTTHHRPRLQRNAKTFRTHGSGIRCSPPDAFPVEPAPRNQYTPTGGSSTKWSHMSVGSASLFREGNRHGWVPVQTSGRQRCHRQKISKREVSFRSRRNREREACRAEHAGGSGRAKASSIS